MVLRDAKSIGVTTIIIAVACACHLFDAGSTLTWIGFMTGIGLGELLHLLYSRAPSKSTVAVKANKNAHTPCAPSTVTAQHVAAVETPEVMATGADYTPPESGAGKGAVEDATLLSGCAFKQNRVGLWQKRFLKLLSGSVYLQYNLEAPQSLNASKGSIAAKGLQRVDLRLCGLVLARGTTLTLHMHDKRIFRFRFSDKIEAATWQRGLYQVVKALHAHKKHPTAAAMPLKSHSGTKSGDIESNETGVPSCATTNADDDDDNAANAASDAADLDNGYWRFLAGCNGDEAAASKRFAATCAWRKAESIDGMLENEPQRHFHAIKALYPHFIHRRAKNGQLVYYEQPGLADVKGLTAICGLAELLRAYVFLTEWMWTVLDPRPEAKIVSVWDMTQCSIGRLSKAQLQMLQQTMHVVGAHYPERNEKLFIVNAPWYFTAMWQVVSPWVDPKTRNNISIHGYSDYQQVLCEYVGAENVPVAFGGTDSTPLGESPEELALKAFIEARLNEATSETSSSSSSSPPSSSKGTELPSEPQPLSTDAATSSADSIDLPISSPSPSSTSTFPDASRIEDLANQSIAALMENASPQSPGWSSLKNDPKLHLTVQTRSQPSTSSTSAFDPDNAKVTTATAAAAPPPRQFRAIIELPYSAAVAYAAVLDNEARLAWDKSIANLVTLTVRTLSPPALSPTTISTPSQVSGINNSAKEMLPSDQSMAPSMPALKASPLASPSSTSSPSSSRSSEIVPFYGLMHCTTRQIGPIQGRDFVDAVYAGPLASLCEATGVSDHRTSNGSRRSGSSSSGNSSGSSSSSALFSGSASFKQDTKILVNGGSGVGPLGHPSFPTTHGLVRGENQPGCGFVFEPLLRASTADDNANRSSSNDCLSSSTISSGGDELKHEDKGDVLEKEWVRVTYCVQSDLKGWLPPSLINATMANVFRDFFRDLSNHIARQQRVTK